MRRFLVIFIALFMSLIGISKAIAGDFSPRYSNSINHYGIGVYFAPKEFTIYSEPDEKSSVVEQIRWDRLGVAAIDDNLSSRSLFMSFVPSKNIALMSVIEDMDDWCQVIYNQYNGAKGWVRVSDSDKFMTWLDFMSKYGRINGVYMFLDLPEEYKIIRTAPDEEASIQDITSYSPDNVKLKFVKGNWMLVKVIDYSRTNTYIGWIKWRNTEGKIFVFPDFKN